MAGYRERAFEMVGEIVMEWAWLDQRIIIDTWQARDPNRQSPFVIGAIEQGFYRRLLDWARLHRSSAKPTTLKDFEAFLAHVQVLSSKRDDLAHNLRDISEANGDHVFGLHGTRLQFDFEGNWARWKRKYLHLLPSARPPQPKPPEHFAYYRPQMAKLLADIIQARERIVEIGEIHRSGRQF